MKHTVQNSRCLPCLLLLLTVALLFTACTPTGGESGGTQTTQAPETTASPGTTSQTEADTTASSDTSSQAEEDTSTPVPDSYGASVGDLCYVQDVKTIESDPYNYDTLFNITQNSGKVTILNFWFTTCMPCTEELPHFDRIATEYADQVLVVAIHAADGYLDSFRYIKENYKNSEILFALDEQNAYYQKLEGYGGYPMTLILDADGRIVAKYDGAINYETLKSVIDPLLHP